jgi:hypothetical protein
MKNNKAPVWQFDEFWGADTDSFNFILYRRRTKKDGSPGNWKPAGYYRDPEQMFLGMFRKLARTESPDPDLVRHVEAISERVQATAARLSEELNAMAWSGLHRPSAHPKQQPRTK